MLAAVRLVQRSLPSEEFTALLDKLNLVRQRFYSILDRIKVIEASQQAVQGYRVTLCFAL